MSSFLLDIVTPGRKVFSEEVDSVSVPTANGIIGILPHHMPILSLLSEGEIKIIMPKKEFYLAIGEGFIEVHKNYVQILVSRAYHADELNEAEINKALASAQDILKKKPAEAERREAYALLRRSTLELKVLSHRRKQRQGTFESLSAAETIH